MWAKSMHENGGFTVIEVIVTLIIVSLFLAVFFQIYLVMESQRVGVARRAAASNIAYTNLRKFSDYATVSSSVTCGASTDLTANASAPGQDISSQMTPEPITGTGLDGTVTQQVVAFYPRGCTANMPILIRSSVSYGTVSPQQKVVHATYVN